MGWLYKQHPVTDPVAYLTGQYNHDGANRTYLVLGAARVSNTVYMAVKSTDKATGQSYVFAAVILISNTQKDGFGYKDMDESVGPCECACPNRIMRLLSPIADIPNPGYAADWRARVAAHKNTAAELRTKRKCLARSSPCRTRFASATGKPPPRSACAFSSAKSRSSSRSTGPDTGAASPPEALPGQPSRRPTPQR